MCPILSKSVLTFFPCKTIQRQPTAKMIGADTKSNAIISYKISPTTESSLNNLTADNDTVISTTILLLSHINK